MSKTTNDNDSGFRGYFEKCCERGEWDHHFDPDSTLGDYYTCSHCGELTQVG